MDHMDLDLEQLCNVATTSNAMQSQHLLHMDLDVQSGHISALERKLELLEDATHNGPPGETLNTLEGTDVKNVKYVHIPYILNGELYEIQTQDGENVTVRCCHCPPDRVYRGSVRSTGNFHMHIKRRHPDLLGKLHDMKVTALLERRDRLMKNRKVTYRSSRSSTSSKMRSVPTTTTSGVGTATTTTMLTNTSPKLKIRSAFQRHQFQQLQQQKQQQQQQHLQQLESMRNWHQNSTPFVVVPISSGSNAQDSLEPINYSIKASNPTPPLQTSPRPSGASIEQSAPQNSVIISPHNNNFSSHFAFGDNLQHSPVQSQSLLTIADLQQSAGEGISGISRSSSPPPQPPSVTQRPLLLHTENSLLTFDRASYDATRCCSSMLSSYESNISVGGNSHYNSLSIVKDEPLLLPSQQPEQAIDLSRHSSLMSESSGIGSAGDTTGAIADTPTTSGNGATFACENATDLAGPSSNLQWNVLLQQVETSLTELQREMHIRNQIETNRIFLDIAKFKYLHPSFHFQC